MTNKEFLKLAKINEDHFYGRKKIEGNLWLNSVTQLPEGFNPNMGGWLDLRSVTQLPKRFYPKVGGNIKLSKKFTGILCYKKLNNNDK